MNNTTSMSFPSMFDVSRNKTSITQDRESIVNRVKLLLLTEPTELYMNPTFGVGLKRYLFQYNTDNVVAQIKDRLIEQLRLWEPCVEADKTQVTRGLTSSNEDDLDSDYNHLKLTITLISIYGDELVINLDDSDPNNFLYSQLK